MKILVTGGTGFIANELLSRLQEHGHDGFNLERYVAGRYSEQKKFNTVFGDLNDAAQMRNIIKDVKPEVVVHFAALTSVAYSYEHPLEVIDANFIGAVNLAEACLKEGENLKKMVFTSSVETYKDTPGILQDEDRTPQEPDSPYGVTKVAAEKYLLYLFRNRKFPVTILRQSNTYGRKRDSNFIVERIITQMLNGGPVNLGSPEPIRDFLYISDLIDAHLKIIDLNVQPGQVINISTSRGTSVQELAQIVAYQTAYKDKINWNSIPPRPREIKWLVADNTKARKILQWEPKIDLKEGIKRTIESWKH